MSRWGWKAAVQRGIASLPRNYYWNELFQRRVTRSASLTAILIRTKLENCRGHIEQYQTYAGTRPPRTVLEVGTGRYPILPVGFYLWGADTVWTFDIYPLLRADGVLSTLRLYVDLARDGRLADALPQARPDRLVAVERCLGRRTRPRAAALLGELGIRVRVGDVSDSALPPGSVDFLMSNTTLQYISRDALRRIFAEFRRLASPEAVMSHRINMEDDFSDFDTSITPFNYLKYPIGAWRWINNALISQNRLRLSDYRRIHQDAGFRIVHEENTEGSPDDLDRIRLAPEFRHYSRQDLLVLRTFLVSMLELSACLGERPAPAARGAPALKQAAPATAGGTAGRHSPVAPGSGARAGERLQTELRGRDAGADG